MERIKSYLAARERSDLELVTYRHSTPLNFLDPESLQRRTSIAIQMATAENARQFYANLAPSDQVLIKTICVDVDDPVEQFVELIEGVPSHSELPAPSENCTPDLIDAFKRSLVEGSADSISQEDPDLYERACKLLEDEYRGVVKKYFDMGIVPNHYVINMHSYLYREFGVSLYHIWFKDKLKNLYAHNDPKVQSLLSQTLNPGGHLNRDELGREKYSVADVDVDDLKNMSQSEIEEFCRQKFRYATPPASRSRVRINQVVELVEFMQHHDLDVVTSPSMVQDWQRTFTKKMTDMIRRIEFMDSITYIPRKSRQIFMSGKASIKSIEEKIKMFENAGLHPVQYGPYLSIPLSPTLANQVICDIIWCGGFRAKTKKIWHI